jgi:hypothetical protein
VLSSVLVVTRDAFSTLSFLAVSLVVLQWEQLSFRRLLVMKQEGEGDWLGAGDVGRREADGAAAGAAVFADSNFTPDPDIPEGPQAPGTERYCFIGQPLARVGF